MLFSRALFLIVAMLFSNGLAFANNLAVTSVSLADQDTGGNTYDIEFDISWDNSWYIAGAPSATANWDAAWVFAKFRKYSSGAWGAWSHCTLLNSGTVTPAGSTITLADTGGVYKGAFVYRSGAGTGSNSWANAQLRWDYGTDGVGDTDKVHVKVFAIEMVLIPSGSFYIGDTNGDNAGNFKWQDGTAGAVLIDTTLGNAVNTVDNSYDDAQLEGSGIRIDGDGGLDTDASGTIDNASFPTGYNAYYVMKYEITQGQYRDFLNTLTRTQQNTRTAARASSIYVMSNTANVNYRSGIRAPASVPSGVITFGCDLEAITAHDTSTGDGTFNESNDGEWVAANYLSWMDGAAYADWAALRPMTGLEFEKAARGQQAAVNDEYAWGDATAESATTSLSNSGTLSEAPNQGNLNYSLSSPDGPYRVGSFADGTSTRANSGGSYYGAMELSGSLWERSVTVGNTQGRSFAGSHGDGTLTTTSSYEGNATNTDWPGIDGTVARGVTGATGCGFRGGTWNGGTSISRVSDRYSAAYTAAFRYFSFGFRGARTSP